MRKKLLSVLLFLPSILLNANINYLHSDSLKRARWGNVFALEGRDSTRELSKITIVPKPQDHLSNSWKVELGGFICTDLFWDSREMAGSRDGAICLYPQDVLYDHNGKDLNAHPSFNFVAMNSRLTIRIQAPAALKANISGMIEGWFMGASNVDMNAFALRHSFIKMDWKSTSLLLGQTWHPLFTEDCFAQTVAASAGAPFQPFSRAPQIRVVQKLGKLSKVMLYINAQRDFLSTGNEGASSTYLRRSAVPEMGLQYHFKYQNSVESELKDELLWGIGINYKYLIPRLMTKEGNYTSTGFSSGTATFFLHYRHYHTSDFRWGFKVKSTFSQACNEYLMLGGYAVRQYDHAALNDSINYSYTPLNVISSWFDLYFSYKSWEFGLFFGNTYSLGAFQQVQDFQNLKAYSGRGIDIHSMYRISCRAKYTIKKLQFGIEPEYTFVRYANHLSSKGRPEATAETSLRNIGGLRMLFSATLFF